MNDQYIVEELPKPGEHYRVSASMMKPIPVDNGGLSHPTPGCRPDRRKELSFD
jgi:hypothetical protein